MAETEPSWWDDVPPPHQFAVAVAILGAVGLVLLLNRAGGLAVGLVAWPFRRLGWLKRAS